MAGRGTASAEAYRHAPVACVEGARAEGSRRGVTLQDLVPLKTLTLSETGSHRRVSNRVVAWSNRFLKDPEAPGLEQEL